MAYTKYHEDWKDYPDQTTPIDAAAMEHIEEGIQDAADGVDALDVRVDVLESAPAPVLDHGALTGLGDDDHPQYHNDARGDARYWPLTTDLATQVELNAEAATRAAADAALDGRLDTIEAIDYATQVELDQAELDLATALAAGDATTLSTAQSYADGKVVSGAYGAGWDGDTTHAPSRNDVYDKIESLGGGGGGSGGYVWDPVAEEYVEGRPFFGPEDPETEGFTPAAGDVWINPDDLTAVPGRLLALTNYNPGTEVDKTATSTSFVDADATNLAVTFVVPASGSVAVRLSGYTAVSGGTALSWGIIESSTVIAGGIVSSPDTSTIRMRCSDVYYVTGLTPGATKTYKWGIARPSGSGTAALRVGGVVGSAESAVMEVYDAATSTGAPEYRDSALLGVTNYNPAVLAAPTASSTSLADVDATNLAVTFVVPASGQVIVTASALTSCTSDGTSLSWGLREGSSALTGTISRVNNVPSISGGAAVQPHVTHKWLITGLTPGATKTYKWAHARDVGAGTAQTIYGGLAGPAIIEVHDAAVGGGTSVPMVDDDTFASASAVTVPSSESVKAYVDGAYAAYTPTITQNGARSTSGVTARYRQIGKMVHAWGVATITNAGTSGQSITVSLPVTALAGQVVLGSAQYYDAGSAIYNCLAIMASTTTLAPYAAGDLNGVPLGQAPAFAVANGDIIRWNVTYEAA